MDASAFAEFVADLDERTRAVPPDIPFSREEYAGRLDRLRAAMAEDGIDTLLLSSPEAMNWLHGLSLRWYKAQAPRMWRPLTCTAVHVDHDRFIQFEGIEHEEMLRRTSIAEDIRLLPRYQRDQCANQRGSQKNHGLARPPRNARHRQNFFEVYG